MKEFYSFPLHIEEEHNAVDNKFCEEQCFRNWVNISALATWKWSESEVAQSSLTLCDPMDCSPRGSSVHGIFQARGLEWGAIVFSRGSSGPRYWTQVSHIVGRCFSIWATDTWIWSLKKKVNSHKWTMVWPSAGAQWTTLFPVRRHDGPVKRELAEVHPWVREGRNRTRKGPQIERKTKLRKED